MPAMQCTKILVYFREFAIKSIDLSKYLERSNL